MLREVTTKYGRIKGLPAADPRITSFKGIPFAVPPVGEMRWHAPEPCAPWEGVLEAYAFKAISVQDRPALGTDIYCREWHVDPDVEINEDCLYLNVWTPAKKTDEKLPVLVWYFGGGLQWGYPSEMEFDGERLARRGIIVVTVNYRLNVFGFLAHPEITKENPDKPSNFGYLDQQLGTRWVKENIAAFGGDPDNITIAGQSAGGGSVMCQITNPANEGLFQKAIVMSGVIGSPYQGGKDFPPLLTLEKGEQFGTEFFEFLGVKSLSEARKLDQDTILSKYNEFSRTHGRLFGICDNKFIFGEAAALAQNGKVLDVPIMAGNTQDEFPNFIAAADESELELKASELFGENAGGFLAFPEAHNNIGGKFAPVNGIELSVKAIFEQRKKYGSKNNFYYYRFNPDIPGEDNPGTFHSCDLWFFFETLAKCSRPYVGRHYDLARHMANYWANYIKTGNPNGVDADGTAMTEWMPYTEEDCLEMEFTGHGSVLKREEHHEFKTFLKEAIKLQKKL